MRKFSKLMMTALAALLVLSLTAGTAAARTALSASPRAFFVHFSPLTLSGGGQTIRCNVLMHVELHESIPKISGTLAGFATIQIFEETCVGSPFGATAGLLGPRGERIRGLGGPYHLLYVSFSGTLPEIRAVTIGVKRVPFWFRIAELITCLVQQEVIKGTSTGGNPATGLETSEGVSGITGSGCPEEGVFEGTSSLFREAEHRTAISSAISLL
jgi:hypothetical protein